MMNDTKQIKEHYERTLLKELEEVVAQIKTEGFTSSTYTSMRLLQDKLAQANTAESFFGAWHEEGDIQTENRKRWA